MPSCRKATTRTSGSESARWARAGRPVAAALLVAGAAGLLVLPQPAVSDQAVAPDRVAAFMRAKLAHAQNVLEGLAVGDYDLIARGAHDLSLASQDSNWQVLQTEDYVRQSAEFRRSCDTLRAAADTKNLDAALVAWMDVTMKCVRCHRSMRDAE